eukprot:7003793-Alexandrium_andersonii.AAC.1
MAQHQAAHDPLAVQAERLIRDSAAELGVLPAKPGRIPGQEGLRGEQEQEGNESRAACRLGEAVQAEGPVVPCPVGVLDHLDVGAVAEQALREQPEGAAHLHVHVGVPRRRAAPTGGRGGPRGGEPHAAPVCVHVLGQAPSRIVSCHCAWQHQRASQEPEQHCLLRQRSSPHERSLAE